MLGSRVVIGIALMLALRVAAPPSDVVVTAAKLRKLRLATQLKDGKLAGCRVLVSSGDPGFDHLACDATAACAAAGVDQSEPLANCVDQRLVAHVRGHVAAERQDDKGE